MPSCAIRSTVGEESPPAAWRSSSCPSDPGGIFIEPYVQTLAEKLKEQIDQAVSIRAEVPDPPEAVLR